jgi:hypothetical protein
VVGKGVHGVESDSLDFGGVVQGEEDIVNFDLGWWWNCLVSGVKRVTEHFGQKSEGSGLRNAR